MTGTPRRRTTSAAAVLALLLAALLGGCGQESPPGEAVPAIADRLDEVDAAVVAKDYDKVAEAVESLMAETTEAEDAGEISGEQADRIRTAAEDLLAQLPTEAPADEPPPSPEPTPTDEDEDGDEGDGEKDDDAKDEDEEKKKDEGKKNERGKGDKGKRDD